MKIKKLWLVMLIAALLFSMMTFGCDEGTSALGDTLKLSGKVYVENYNEETDTSTFSVYSGTALTLKEYETQLTATVSATGDLSFTMDAPDAEHLVSVSSMTDDMVGGDDDPDTIPTYTNIKISNDNAKVFVLSGFSNNVGDKYYSLSRQYEDMQQNINATTGSFSASMDEIMVAYYYVTEDVKITATGSTSNEGMMGLPIKTEFKNINLSLKKGWNVVTVSMSMSANGNINNMEQVSGKFTISIAAGDNSKARWVLDID